MGDAEDEFNEMEGGDSEAAKKQVSPASHTGGIFFRFVPPAENMNKLMSLKYLVKILSLPYSLEFHRHYLTVYDMKQKRIKRRPRTPREMLSIFQWVPPQLLKARQPAVAPLLTLLP